MHLKAQIFFCINNPQPLNTDPSPIYSLVLYSFADIGLQTFARFQDPLNSIMSLKNVFKRYLSNFKRIFAMMGKLVR